MAKFFNRAWMSTATAGTGTITLGSALTGYATFAEAGVANSDVVSYVILDGDDFEIGYGTYTSAGTTLSRDEVTMSKIGGVAGTTKITLSGSATVFISPRREDLQPHNTRVSLLTPHENLVCSRASASTISVSADAVDLFTTRGESRRFTSLSETIDITTTGANGRDGGSETSSTWYYIHAIGKADGTLDALLSTSATSPTLPSGYTYSGLLGAARNDGSSNLINFYQRGNIVTQSEQAALSGGTQTNFTAISLSAYVPPIATCVMGSGWVGTSAGSHTNVAVFAPEGATTTPTYGSYRHGGVTVDTNGLYSQIGFIPMTTPQQIKYYVFGTNATAYFYVEGWMF